MKLLKEILSLPTAPFHESSVAACVIKHSMRLKLPVRSDRAGNLAVRYRRGRAVQPVIFTAHMDHPGFVVLRASGRTCEVGILGGINEKFFAGARVVIQTRGGLVKGRVAKRPLKKKWMGKSVHVVNLQNVAQDFSPANSISRTKDLRYILDEVVHSGDYGWYDLPGFKLKKGIIYTKGADNLASVASLFDLLYTLKKKRTPADVTCLFTRAEEVGFIGCIAVAESNAFPKNTPIVVLECSSASAGKVAIGGGPVLRVGDKLSCFSSEVDCWFRYIADDISKRDKRFKFQRALLPGGRCEASVWTLAGRKIGGLAFPLGNYHNNGPKKYEPEFVSLADYKWMQQLLLGIAVAGHANAGLGREKKLLSDNYKKWKRFLYE